jgi:hypothetical protein
MSEDKTKKDKPAPEVPAEASDANAAVRAEAEGTEIVFEHEGETYTVGSGDDWPREAGLAYSEISDSKGNPARVFKFVDQFVSAVLGPAQYARFTRGAGAKVGGVNGMYQKLFEVYGFTSGE